MADLSDAMVVRDLLLVAFCQMLENQHLTPVMEELLRKMEFPPGVEKPERWVPDVHAWILATHHLRRALQGLRLMDLGDQGIEEVNYEPILRIPDEDSWSTEEGSP